MRSLFEIVTGFTVAFLLLAVILSSSFGEAEPVGYWQKTLTQFDRQVFSYNKSDLPKKTVVIGPSYAANLGPLTPPAFNLGCGTATLAEQAAIIRKYLHPQDRIFHCITFTDVTQDRPDIRWSFISTPARKMLLAKMQARNAAGIQTNAFGDASPRRRHLSTDKAVLERAAGRSLLPRSVQSIMNMLNSPLLNRPMSLEPLESLAADFPNIVFVIFPTMNLSPPEGSSPLCLAVQKYARLRNDFDHAIKSSNLPIIDLTGIANNADFGDLVHLKNQRLLRERLAALINLEAA